MKFVFLLIIIISCASTHQGIEGKVFWLSGNQMPGPDRKPEPQQGVSREIYIYKIALLENNPINEGFFEKINSDLVAKVRSKSDGSFKIKLPEGDYSILVKEEKGLFANLFDGTGRINPISVKKGTFSWISITVDFEASY